MSKKDRGRNVKGEKHSMTISKGDVAKLTISDAPKQEETPTPPPVEAKPILIKVVKRDAKYRGAREAWYTRLLEHDGKTLDEFIESCKTKCPQLTKNGTPEPPLGWVGFFKRQGVMQEVKGE